MYKKVIVILSLLVCCYCLENNEQLPEEARAKKKKGSLKLFAIAALVVLAKIAIAKIASFLFFVAFFQKLFYVGGIFLNYFLKNQGGGPPTTPPQIMYGSPQEYNTVGYSYEAPDHEPFQAPELPSIADFSNGVKWLFNKQN